MTRTLAAIATVVALLTLATPEARAEWCSMGRCTEKSLHNGPFSMITIAPEIRVDQGGYPGDGAKVGYVMVGGPVGSVRFTVVDARGTISYRGVSREDLGGWNSRYRAVYALDFSTLRRAGTYRVAADGAVSPAFRIASGEDLYQPLLDNAIRYFTSERDGENVVQSVLDREPANLTDARAYVYAAPRYDSNDNLLGSLHRTGGPVDVSGGWFDAGGGYEKFGYTGSYTDALLLIAARSAGRDSALSSEALSSEAQFGLKWMTRLWNPSRRVMYMQAGIGNGNASGTIEGDYDFWFLPQSEDRLGAKPGSPDYYVEYRPVFEAAAPGHLVSPDLAGRYAADYALGAQVAARDGRRPDTRSGARLLALARSVYADAQTSGVRSIVTTYPYDYYPGTEWRADMFWGAAEIVLADEALGVRGERLRADLATAARWALAYLAEKRTDTLNLYDTGALAEAELLRALRQAKGPAPIAPKTLVAGLAAQLRFGEAAAGGDPFGLGTSLGNSDATPHAFGLYVTDELYRENGGTSDYAAFAQKQLDFALGANGWGSSFVVGAGSVYPHCMQSEIANLAGSLTGRGDIQLGAVTDGPSAPANFTGLGTVPGMRACSYGSYGSFDTTAAAYEDNVVSWPSVEPADDYTAISLLAFALGASHEHA